MCCFRSLQQLNSIEKPLDQCKKQTPVQIMFGEFCQQVRIHNENWNHRTHQKYWYFIRPMQKTRQIKHFWHWSNEIIWFSMKNRWKSNYFIRPVQKSNTNQWFSVCLMSGNKRAVRKIFNSMDLEISRLKRTRFGPIFLPSKLKKGNYLNLSNKEIEALKNYGT